MDPEESPPRVLCIGGTDPTGAAGLYSDMKTLAALGVAASGVVTAVTVQTQASVTEVLRISGSLVRAQIEAALSEGRQVVVKTGMLGDYDTVLAVADALDTLGARGALVVDPVFAASSGRPLLDAEGRQLLCERLLPATALLTPNCPEAESLSGVAIRSLADMRRAADSILALGPSAVLIKGGHLPFREAADETETEVVDLLRTLDGDEYLIRRARVPGPGFRGTGCALASAIAGRLAEGRTLHAAVDSARDYLQAVMFRTRQAAPLPHHRPLALLHGPLLPLDPSPPEGRTIN